MIMSKNDYNFKIDEVTKKVTLYGSGMMGLEDGIEFVRRLGVASQNIQTSEYTMIIDCRWLYLVSATGLSKQDFEICARALDSYVKLGYKNIIMQVNEGQDMFKDVAKIFNEKEPEVKLTIEISNTDTTEPPEAFNFTNDILFKTLNIKYDASSNIGIDEMLNQFSNLFAVLNPAGYTLNFKFSNKDKLKETDKVNFLKRLIPEIKKYGFLSVVLNIKKDFPVDFIDNKDLEIFNFS